MSTELFDLFGEAGYCTICQDDLVEGERIRAISECQHLFHAKCLDAWLAQKGECPLCRVAVVFEAAAVVTPVPIQATRAEEIAAQIQRYSLTYALMDGILRKFPTAVAYREVRHQVRTLVWNLALSGTRPLPTDYSYRAQIEAKKRECTVWLATQMQSSSHRIRSLPHVIAWRLRLVGRPTLTAVWQAP